MSSTEPSSEVVRACLGRLLASPIFVKAHRQSAFLSHVVESGLTGNDEALKEYQIGLIVYQRGKAYDTRTDPIVRVEAARLRAKLREYYESQGSSDPVRIELPKGAYSPVFHWVDNHQIQPTVPSEVPGNDREPVVPETTSSKFRWLKGGIWPFMVAAGLIGFVVAGVWLVRARQGELAAGMPRSIAVLRFRDLSDDKVSSELCDALTESLTDELSRIDGLLVAGRTSTARMSDRNLDLVAVGRELNVGSVLEGSIQSSGTQVRVRVRLFDVASGFQLWSGTFDRSSAEAFAVQDEISHSIATTLRLQLGRRREDPEVMTSPARRRSQDLYTKGRQLHRKGDTALLEQARDFHVLSVQADPSYALAHSGLAHINITIMSEGLRPVSELRLETIKSIDRALSLDPGLGDAYSARIRLARDIDTDWRTVERTCQDVTRLFPNAASIRGNCGTAYSILGRFQQAESELRASVRLDPYWFGGLEGLAWMLYLSGRPEEALRQADEIRRVIPDYRGVRRSYGRFLAGSGKFVQAKEFLERELAASPESPELWALLGYVRGRMNDKRGARECLSHLGARPLEVDQALIWLGLGDQNQAVAHLERALEKHETAGVEVLVDPGLQFGPQQRRLRAKVGL